MPTQIEPLLGQNAEPDPTFFVESWTIGVTGASENYLRRHQHEKDHPAPAPMSFPSYSFVTFLNVDPHTPIPTQSSPKTSMSDGHSFARRTRSEEDNEAFVPGPLTFQSACRLLGVTATSTRDEIRAAYRKMASRYHPDRLAAAGVGDSQFASDRMASINEAYRLLCDSAVAQSALR
ncbi:MAG TPA: J domain-containing protein [Acidobacteriaceae bacterium]|nr:J domain-containing protein [Acidobacteriaceae bacterium]